MARKKRTYDDDDGRTIADMSGVGRRSMFVPNLPRRSDGESEPSGRQTEQEDYSQYYRKTKDRDSRRENFTLAAGALGAALLIGAVFLVVFAIVIALMIYFWA